MGIVEADHPRLVFVSVHEAINPPGGLINHIKDSWWVLHPAKGLVFWDKRSMSPQCNSNEAVTHGLAKMYPWAEVKFLPSVFHRIKISDYV